MLWIKFRQILLIMVAGSCLITKQSIHIEFDRDHFKLVDGRLLKNGVAFTGILRKNSGELLHLISYKAGLRQGPHISIFANGQVYRTMTFMQGRKVGLHKSYYRDGTLRTQATFKNGQHHGEMLMWHQNGQMFSYDQYDMGHVIAHKAWRENGRIYQNYVFKNGKRLGLNGGKLCLEASD